MAEQSKRCQLLCTRETPRFCELTLVEGSFDQQQLRLILGIWSNKAQAGVDQIARNFVLVCACYLNGKSLVWISAKPDWSMGERGRKVSRETRSKGGGFPQRHSYAQA